MLDIVYFVPGDYDRYINKHWKAKTTIGDGIIQEGYFIGTAEEKQKCWIFHGKPYMPSKTEIPSHVDFDPNCYRCGIIQESIQYFLVRHKKSGAYFAICRYMLSSRYQKYRGVYFSDLLTFIDGEWKQIREWPFDAEPRHANDKIAEYWRKYGNYYEEDFEIIRELKGA